MDFTMINCIINNWKTSLFAGSLILALYYLFRNTINDGFPTARTETDEVQAIVEYLNEMRNQYPIVILCWYSVAYLSRQMLPISGIFSMHIIAGALYGTTCGVLLCVFLCALAAFLTYSTTQLIMNCFHEPTFDKNNKPPLKVAAFIGLKIDGIPTISGNPVSWMHCVSLARRAATNDELATQTLGMSLLRLLNLMFNFVPSWFLNIIIVAAQFPLKPFILSAMIAGVAHSQSVTLVDQLYEQPGFIREWQHKSQSAANVFFGILTLMFILHKQQ